MNSANKLITENLKRWMEATPALSSQTAVARAAKVGQSHISRIYRGNANPTVDIIEAIAKAFKRKPADLFTDATSDDAQSAQTAAAANDAPPANTKHFKQRNPCCWMAIGLPPRRIGRP